MRACVQTRAASAVAHGLFGQGPRRFGLFDRRGQIGLVHGSRRIPHFFVHRVTAGKLFDGGTQELGAGVVSPDGEASFFAALTGKFVDELQFAIDRDVDERTANRDLQDIFAIQLDRKVANAVGGIIVLAGHALEDLQLARGAEIGTPAKSRSSTASKLNPTDL